MAKRSKKNTKKNTGGTTGKGFDVSGQPSSAAKKAGWERRRQAQKIMDMLLELQDMTLEEFQKLQDDVKRNPGKHTVIEMKLAQYLSREKFTVDFLDRHISKAPVQQELTGKDGGPVQVVPVIVPRDLKD